MFGMSSCNHEGAASGTGDSSFLLHGDLPHPALQPFERGNTWTLDSMTLLLYLRVLLFAGEEQEQLSS